MYGPKSALTNVLSEEELEAISPEDLISRIKTLAGMQHRIIYYGPMAEKDVVAKINELHNVPDKLQPVPAPVKFPLLPTPENKVYIAHYDAKQLYYIQYSNRGEKFDPVNYPGISMYNEYFGGGMNAIVFQEMREARGLAYSASARLGTPGRKDVPYTYTAFIATQNDKMAEAIDAFEEIINDMPESQNAFDLARNSLISRMRTERIIKSGIAWNYIRAQDLGIDFDWRKSVYEQAQTMTLEDVKAFQQKWVKDRPYTFCILGDTKDLNMKKLQELGPVTKLSQEEIFGY